MTLDQIEEHGLVLAIQAAHHASRLQQTNISSYSSAGSANFHPTGASRDGDREEAGGLSLSSNQLGTPRERKTGNKFLSRGRSINSSSERESSNGGGASGDSDDGYVHVEEKPSAELFLVGLSSPPLPLTSLLPLPLSARDAHDELSAPRHCHRRSAHLDDDALPRRGVGVQCQGLCCGHLLGRCCGVVGASEERAADQSGSSCFPCQNFSVRPLPCLPCPLVTDSPPQGGRGVLRLLLLLAHAIRSYQSPSVHRHWLSPDTSSSQWLDLHWRHPSVADAHPPRDRTLHLSLCPERWHGRERIVLDPNSLSQPLDDGHPRDPRWIRLYVPLLPSSLHSHRLSLPVCFAYLTRKSAANLLHISLSSVISSPSKVQHCLSAAAAVLVRPPLPISPQSLQAPSTSCLLLRWSHRLHLSHPMNDSFFLTLVSCAGLLLYIISLMLTGRASPLFRSHSCSSK
jgi:hypothetical protein